MNYVVNGDIPTVIDKKNLIAECRVYEDAEQNEYYTANLSVVNNIILVVIAEAWARTMKVRNKSFSLDTLTGVTLTRKGEGLFGMKREAILYVKDASPIRLVGNHMHFKALVQNIAAHARVPFELI